MTPSQRNELLAAIWLFVAAQAFATSLPVIGWIAVVLAVLNVIVGVLNA